MRIEWQQRAVASRRLFPALDVAQVWRRRRVPAAQQGARVAQRRNRRMLNEPAASAK